MTSRASSLTLPKWWASWRKDAFVERQLLSWLALLLRRSLSLEEGCGPLPLETSCAGLLGSASCAWCGMRPVTTCALHRLESESCLGRRPLSTLCGRGSGDRPLPLTRCLSNDGVIAGDVAAVQQALQEVERRGAAIGLRLNLAKCEVVRGGRLDASTLLNRLPPELLRTLFDGASRLQWNFELLGAAVGDVTFSAVNTLERVDKAAPLLEEDAQVALRLLRSCAGHCRMDIVAWCTQRAAAPLVV